jgi:hypothetical protein
LAARRYDVQYRFAEAGAVIGSITYPSRFMPPEATQTTRLIPAERTASLRIAVLAGPWIPVPPPGYGGTEEVVDLLCEELVARGHDVTLFAAPGSQSTATVMTPLERAHPDAMGSSLHESDHVASAWDALDRAAVRRRT